MVLKFSNILFCLGSLLTWMLGRVTPFQRTCLRASTAFCARLPGCPAARSSRYARFAFFREMQALEKVYLCLLALIYCCNVLPRDACRTLHCRLRPPQTPACNASSALTCSYVCVCKCERLCVCVDDGGCGERWPRMNSQEVINDF